MIIDEAIIVLIVNLICLYFLITSDRAKAFWRGLTGKNKD
jgi:hypothetical protein